MSDEPLRPEGLRALHAERVKNLELKREVRDTRLMLHNLRAAVIDLTNELIDLIESDGALRQKENTNV